MDTIKIDDRVTNGPQPSEDELRGLSQEGFKTVVNFRESGEEEQPLSPEQEQQKVEALGMDYLHFPVSMKSMSAEQVDRFREQASQLTPPVFAHCKTGKRSGAFFMMDHAVREGWTGEETLEKAEQMGFECDQEDLRELVKSYVDSRRA